ncbi:flagellin [Halovibrio salipaludis]|uniref:Flagellin n=1 Tax=Halovibrio salipaludis TaxID=2032626 RepID=A0A2A2F642_9GAMM|nr:flagellin [Halovibrio salipaludis]PAU80184.1 flagellin [Halovibrio salipaludis]
MPQVINTNIASINAQRNLNNTQGEGDTALERLSSGLRINSAKDDAAGLAISERFTAQINGLDQAVRNANDGTSLAQVAEGALGESANSLQRIRELAIQSANATNSQSDRDALQAEVSQLKEEIGRIADETEFNGLKVLDGSYTDEQYQIGANANQTIGVSIDTAQPNQMGSVVNQASDVEQTDAVDGGNDITTTRGGIETYTGVSTTEIDSNNGLEINGEVVEPSERFTGTLPGQDEADSAYAKAAAINGSSIDGVEALAETSKAVPGIDPGNTANEGSALAVFGGADNENDTGKYSLTINDQRVLEENFNENNTELSLTEAADRINASTDQTGVRARVNADDELVFTAEDGRNIEINEDMEINNDSGEALTLDSAFIGNGEFSEDTATNTASAENTYTYRGDITLQSAENITLNDDGADLLGFSNNLIEVDEEKNVETIDISSVEGANEAILAVDAALTNINGIRADLGAVQNRFESTIANLESGSENLNAARSRIQDADFAQESAELSRTQTLQQAGLSVLSQANQRPQQVLQLIQG